jgi:hypothetical protein
MLTFTVKAGGQDAGRAVVVRRQRGREDAAHRAGVGQVKRIGGVDREIRSCSIRSG